MYHVAKALANLFSDVLTHTDDEARRPHLDDLPVVWHIIEGSVNRQASFPEDRLDVERHFHVGGIHSLVLKDDGIEFVWRC